MRSSRWTVLLSVLLVGLLMMTACAPRATGGDIASRAGEADVAIDLPALVLDIQADGSLAVGGQSLAELGAAVGQDLSALSVPPETAQAMVDAGVQHIQIDNTDDGLLILVNGKAIPSLAWDGESLVTTAQVLDQLGAAPIALLDKILPLIRNLGFGVIIRAPIPEGTEPLPFVSPDSETAERAMSAQQEFLQSVMVPPTFSIGVDYAEDGTWEVAGINVQELEALAPGLGSALTFPPATIQQLSAMGIDQIGFSTNENGFFISVNGQNLPYITWSDGRIANVLDLVVQTGALDNAMPGMDAETLLQYVEALLPSLLATDLNLNVNFP